METFLPIEWLYLIVVILVLLLSGLFAAAEMSLLSVNRFRVHQLAEDGTPQAKTLERLLRQPAQPLTAILILLTAINYMSAILVTLWLYGLRGWPGWVSFLALLLLVLIFAQVIPIHYAAANPEAVATGAAPLLAVATTMLRPIVSALTVIANAFVRLLGGEPRQRPLVTGEEVRTIVDIETERGVLEEEEKELIHSIFEFSDTIVREIMAPRIDIVAVSSDTSIAEVIDTTIANHFSRLPVYQGNLDHIIGLVHVKDLLPFELKGRSDEPVLRAMRPATVVPESKRVSELLREFRESKQTLAIVIDEYGGTAGLVTVEDLLEEIVGEIYDEYDIEQRSVEWLDDHTVIVDGKLSIYELADLLDHAFPEGDYDTVGGLLYHRFGDVPARGEKITIDQYEFTVDRLDGHRIAKVRVVRPEQPREAGNA